MTASYRRSSADEVISSRISDVHHPTRDSSFYALRIFNVSVKTSDLNHTCDAGDNPSYKPTSPSQFKKRTLLGPWSKCRVFHLALCTAAFTTTWGKHWYSEPEQETQACCWLQSGELCSVIISLVNLDRSCSRSSRWFVANSRGAGCAPWQQLGPWFQLMGG